MDEHAGRSVCQPFEVILLALSTELAPVMLSLFSGKFLSINSKCTIYVIHMKMVCDFDSNDNKYIEEAWFYIIF